MFVVLILRERFYLEEAATITLYFPTAAIDVEPKTLYFSLELMSECQTSPDQQAITEMDECFLL